MAATPDDMMSAVSASLAARTGRSLDEWVALVALRPIYDAVAAAILDLGDDVTVEGRGTYTPFVRARQFAAVAPAAKDRVDLGLRFTDPPATFTGSRLAPAKGLAQATHKIPLRSVAEVDDEVRGLLRVAYEQNG